VAQELGQRALALLNRRAAQVLVVYFEQVESAEDGRGVVPVNREAVLVADDGLTVEQAGPHRQHRHRRDNLRKAVRKVGALSREQPHPAVGTVGQDAENRRA
jgi:hypothetical protein